MLGRLSTSTPSNIPQRIKIVVFLYFVFNNLPCSFMVWTPPLEFKDPVEKLTLELDEGSSHRRFITSVAELETMAYT